MWVILAFFDNNIKTKNPAKSVLAGLMNNLYVNDKLLPVYASVNVDRNRQSGVCSGSGA